MSRTAAGAPRGRDVTALLAAAALQALPGAAQPGAPGTLVQPDAVQAPPRGGEADPLGTVGLALLAYGLVQLLSKVVDKLPVGKNAGEAAGAPAGTPHGFTADDRKRLERVLEQVVTDHEWIERLQEAVREIHEATRWMSEARHRSDPRDGQPAWQCRARTLSEPLAVNQRLSGQALDELREVNAKLDNVLRKLRALWLRLGRRRRDHD